MFQCDSSYIHDDNAMDISTEVVKFVAFEHGMAHMTHNDGTAMEDRNGIKSNDHSTQCNAVANGRFHLSLRGSVVRPYTFLQDVMAKIIRNIDWFVWNFWQVKL